MSNNEDSTASIENYTLLGTMFLVIATPLVFIILKTILSNTKELSKPGVENCTCSKCCERVVNYHSRKYREKFTKGFWFKVLITVVLIYFTYKSFAYVSDESEKINYKDFDPYEILNVKYSSSPAEIKKAYRKLMTSHHPDKQIRPGMPAKEVEAIRKNFIRIVKAYEILTDPVKKENFERFGDPDGPKGIDRVLPTFLTNKKLHLPIIIVFLVIVMIVLPLYVMLYLRGDSDYDENGNSKTNQSIFYYYLNEHTQPKHIPYIVGNAVEFKDFKVRSEDEKELNELWSLCKPFTPTSKKDNISYSNKKAITLLYAWLSRMDNISSALKEDTKVVVVKSALYVLPQMISFSSMINKLKQENKKLKTFGISCTRSIYEFSQCIHQRLWFDFSPFLQLPYLDQDDIKNYVKKEKKNAFEFNKFLKSDSDTKEKHLDLIKPELTSSQKTEILKVSSFIPIFTPSVHYYVAGLDDILVRDFVTIDIKVNRINRQNDSLKTGMPHSEYFPEYFEEKIGVLLSIYDVKEDTRKLISDDVLTFPGKEISFSIGYQPQEVSQLIYIIKG